MHIDDELHLAFPVGADAHVFHTPISTAVFDANYSALATVYARFLKQGVHFEMAAGPMIAARALRDALIAEAVDAGNVLEDGSGNPAKADAFVAEIKRLTMVVAPTAAGWAPQPIDAAIRSHAIDARDWDEALGAIVFFTCYYTMTPHRRQRQVAEAIASALGWQLVSSNATAYAAGLPTSTTPATTAAAA